MTADARPAQLIEHRPKRVTPQASYARRWWGGAGVRERGTSSAAQLPCSAARNRLSVRAWLPSKRYAPGCAARHSATCKHLVPPGLGLLLADASGGVSGVQSLGLLGRHEPDFDQVEWADEAVTDPETAGACNRVT